jgi:hypothetical protein
MKNRGQMGSDGTDARSSQVAERCERVKQRGTQDDKGRADGSLHAGILPPGLARSALEERWPSRSSGPVHWTLCWPNRAWV